MKFRVEANLAYPMQMLMLFRIWNFSMERGIAMLTELTRAIQSSGYSKNLIPTCRGRNNIKYWKKLTELLHLETKTCWIMVTLYRLVFAMLITRTYSIPLTKLSFTNTKTNITPQVLFVVLITQTYQKELFSVTSWSVTPVGHATTSKMDSLTKPPAWET